MPYTEILDFWFGNLTNGFANEAHRTTWFARSDDFDESIRTRFAPCLETAATGGLTEWLETSQGRLAYIIATDQFPRNLYRDSPTAFATDHLALTAAKAGIHMGADQHLALDERSFFYLPFEHCERLEEQHTCVGLFMQLRDQTPAGQRHITGSSLRFAQQHRDVIQTFGRFPHRNRALNRVSTPAELSYLAAGGGFSQKVEK
ncbi:MAG: DUF924 domain-containing protein [Proteobacteria bacterium]|nr:DUF924 domain-containing protein [Pseudomonadota bacterium]